MKTWLFLVGFLPRIILASDIVGLPVASASAFSGKIASTGTIGIVTQGSLISGDYEEVLVKIVVRKYSEFTTGSYRGVSWTVKREYTIDWAGVGRHTVTRTEPGKVTTSSEYFDVPLRNRSYSCSREVGQYDTVSATLTLGIGYEVPVPATNAQNISPNPLPCSLLWQGVILSKECTDGYWPPGYSLLQEKSAPRRTVSLFSPPHSNLEVHDIGITPH